MVQFLQDFLSYDDATVHAFRLGPTEAEEE